MKKEFKKPIAEMIAMETISNILANSYDNPEGNNDSNGQGGGRARQVTGSITPISSSEAFGD